MQNAGAPYLLMVNLFPIPTTYKKDLEKRRRLQIKKIETRRRERNHDKRQKRQVQQPTALTKLYIVCCNHHDEI